MGRVSDFDLKEFVREVVREELARAKPAPITPAVVSVAAYARERSISESTVRKAIRDHRLDVVRIGSALRVPVAAVIGKRPVANDRTDRARARLLGTGR